LAGQIGDNMDSRRSNDGSPSIESQHSIPRDKEVQPSTPADPWILRSTPLAPGNQPEAMDGCVDNLLWSFFTSVSRALDLSYAGIMSHHLRVAVITAKVGQALGLSQERIAQACHAALIHDLGVSTWGERAKLHQFEVDDPYEHALDGYRILTRAGAVEAADQALFLPYAELILHHHDKWEGGNPTPEERDAIPLESRIIHLADRLDVLLDESRPFSAQSEDVLEGLEGHRVRVFDPEILDVIKDLAKSESFWFDLEANFLSQSLAVCAAEGCSDRLAPSSLDTVEVLARVFAEVVDRRSPYTQAHSRAVGECAFMMGRRMGLDDLTCRELRMAGLLHDLGKMGVPEELLNKPGSLTGEEWCAVKRHPYLTYHLLNSIPGFGRIAKWASFHHERLDGQGYPFRLDSSALPLEARIVAVCDVYSALSERRPYRPGLSRDEVQRLLVKMAKEGALDRDVVDAAREALWGVFDLVAATGS